MINWEGTVKDGIRRVDFEFSEFLAAATAEHSSFRPEMKHSSGPGKKVGSRWHGVNFEVAEDYYKNGWEEGLKKIAEVRSQLDGQLQCRYAKMEPTYEVYGGVPDVGVFLSGDPENMIHRHASEKVSESCGERKVVSMVVNISASACSDNETIALVRGSIACAVLDVLESLNFRVEVYAAMGQLRTFGNSLRFKEQELHMYVKLKDASQPLEMSRMAFTLCHNSMYRRISFAVMEYYGFDESNGCGVPREVKEKGDIYIPHADVFKFGNDLQSWTQKSIEVLKSIGITIE